MPLPPMPEPLTNVGQKPDSITSVMKYGEKFYIGTKDLHLLDMDRGQWYFYYLGLYTIVIRSNLSNIYKYINILKSHIYYEFDI